MKGPWRAGCCTSSTTARTPSTSMPESTSSSSGQARAQQRQLQQLVALALAAGEVLVDRAASMVSAGPGLGLFALERKSKASSGSAGHAPRAGVERGLPDEQALFFTPGTRAATGRTNSPARASVRASAPADPPGQQRADRRVTGSAGARQRHAQRVLPLPLAPISTSAAGCTSSDTDCSTVGGRHVDVAGRASWGRGWVCHGRVPIILGSVRALSAHPTAPSSAHRLPA